MKRQSDERTDTQVRGSGTKAMLRRCPTFIAVLAVIIALALGLGTLLVVRTNILTPDAEAQSQSGTSVKSSASNVNGAGGSDSTNAIATLYIHGYNGGTATTNSMIAYAEQHDGATKVLTATIATDGTVSLEGTWNKNTASPIIQVLFGDNTNEDYDTTTQWMYNLITTLQKRYGITQYNIVAHSMGNLVAMYYEEQYGQDSSLPKLAKMVNIAGNFDGELGVDDEANKNSLGTDGAPKYQNKDYHNLLAKRSNFPTEVGVLNIFGNLDDGTNSDGDITTVSARSLGYLLQAITSSYREIEVHGASGQHSQLHEDDQLTADIDNFLCPET